jgi:hypothetical protein
MSNRVSIEPRWSGALAFWLGSDHYGLLQALRREPFIIPVDQVSRVYEIRAKPLIGLGSPMRYAVEYRSAERECFITLDTLPAELKGLERTTTNPPGAALLFFQHCKKEPTALLLPLVVPFFAVIMILLLGAWNELVLQNHDVLAFFATPGCNEACVRKALSLHSLVAFLFLVQIAILLLPMALFFIGAPRYKSALNYRMIQSYSFVTVVVTGIIFLQLVAIFPFRQYTKFVEMGFSSKTERLLSNLNSKKH